MEGIYCIRSELVLRKSKIKPGDTVKLVPRGDSERKEIRTVKVLERYRHHALLDFGKYKECRRIVDLELGIAEP